MTIRIMTKDDYDAVSHLWRSTPGMGLNDRDDSCFGIERYLRRNPTTCFVAEKEGQITGAILAGHDGRRGFIYHTAVAPSLQRQGIGSALVAAALDALKQEGITKVALVVFSKNAAGNQFWERQGFTLRTDLSYRNKALAVLNRLDT